MDELIKLVEELSKDAGLAEAESSEQILKIIERVGVVAAALSHNDEMFLREGIGYVVFHLIVLAQQHEMDLHECLYSAYCSEGHRMVMEGLLPRNKHHGGKSMNFKKLQEMQRALDDAILKEKPEMREVERLNKTFIALSVEIAELANTAEHFKFWKENKGKIDWDRFKWYSELMDINLSEKDELIDLRSVNPSGETFNSVVTLEQAHHLTLVEEASDCLHFILSLANQLHEELDELVDLERDLPEWVDTKDSCYKELLWCVADNETTVDTILAFFMKYVQLLGINLEELEQAYYDKNEINYQRLREGY